MLVTAAPLDPGPAGPTGAAAPARPAAPLRASSRAVGAATAASLELGSGSKRLREEQQSGEPGAASAKRRVLLRPSRVAGSLGMALQEDLLPPPLPMASPGGTTSAAPAVGAPPGAPTAAAGVQQRLQPVAGIGPQQPVPAQLAMPAQPPPRLPLAPALQQPSLTPLLPTQQQAAQQQGGTAGPQLNAWGLPPECEQDCRMVGCHRPVVHLMPCSAHNCPELLAQRALGAAVVAAVAAGMRSAEASQVVLEYLAAQRLGELR